MADGTSTGGRVGAGVCGIEIIGVDQRDAWKAGEVPGVTQVRPGIFSLPVVFPDNPLRYTLCYLFMDAGGPVLVDPGFHSPISRASLDAVLAQVGLRAEQVAGVVVTHVHPDHHGLSAEVTAVSGCWVGMHRDEAASLATLDVPEEERQRLDRTWLDRLGVPPEIRPEIATRMGEVADQLARPTVLFDDGDLLPLTDHRVRCVHTPGHTPGHLCLSVEMPDGGRLFLSGDHVLPRISPHIGMQPISAPPPLVRYLASLRKVAAFDDAEVLPGHEWRFRGLARRVDELLEHHERRCAEILDTLDPDPGTTAWDLTTRLTWSRGWPAVQGYMRRSALAETLAHLQHLQGTGQVLELTPAGTGASRFVRAG
ncbi:MBL fold metallo-hydrolase [Nakamurella sp. YIM 132087]|uniref:MBL fold metallo-hydrolase n=1 Tax=Nakamurella alba TaxID=2665158 RepID=A0A7K1FQK1_9ACTN|nr:MBL fold metallo-hydrolase [Nakamurella alba]MTD16350.1 MBL fold metallo-hydrolase [Nakamurella alba]